MSQDALPEWKSTILVVRNHGNPQSSHRQRHGNHTGRFEQARCTHVTSRCHSVEKQLGKVALLMMRKNCNYLYMSILTIQLEVDMMSENPSSRNPRLPRRVDKDRSSGNQALSSRPSRRRNTESISGSCEVCGSNSWDSDEIRGETTCSDCGYVASRT